MGGFEKEQRDSSLNIPVFGADAMKASISAVMIWTYSLEKHSMTFEYVSEDNTPCKSFVFENFSNSFKELHYVFADDEAIFDVFCAELEAGQDNILEEFRCISDTFQHAWYRFVGNAVKDENGVVTAVKGRRYDISREKSNKDTALVQDSLTGLYHRDKFREIVSAELDKDKENNSAFIIIDFDDFHVINEKFGRMQGDAVMQTVSGMIYTNFMSKDVIGRIAGDQFAVFCRNIEEEKVLELLSELQNRISSNIAISDSQGLTFSAGIAMSPRDGMAFEMLYPKADIALYAAKEKGKNRFEVVNFKDMGEIGIGYTLLKMGCFEEDENRTVKSSKEVNKKLFDYAFDELSKEADVTTAIKKIFEEACLHFSLDRAILHEKNYSTDHVEVTSSWCKVDGKVFDLEESDWYDISNNVPDEGYIIYKDGRALGLDFFRKIVEFDPAPVNCLQFCIKDGDALNALFSFETFESHEFTGSEISTLRAVVRLISSYLLNQQNKSELETESIINQNVMDAQKVVYYVIDENTHEIKYISKYAKKIYPDAKYGQKCYEAIAKYKDGHCPICPIHQGEGDNHAVKVYSEDKDKWFSLTATKMTNTDSCHDVLICITDVTDLLLRLRGEDNLTIADSYDSFVMNATKAVIKSERTYGVVCAGIKNFAKINDEYGYVAGDDILKRFAEMIKADLKEGELLCRIKGDDFAILTLQDDLTNENSFESSFVNYSGRLTEEFKRACPGIEIKCFAGQYIISDKNKYINHCVDNAMKARKVAYSERNTNGGFYTYSREFEEREQNEYEMNKLIKDSLKENRFKVFFQPKVDVETEKVIGAEALVRLQGEDGKMISPGLFVPLAEKTGLIVDIDRNVYEQTFSYMSRWQKEGKCVPLVSVNVSRLHLIDDLLPERMKELADKYELDPSQIELEITESVFFEDTERLINMIKRLKDMGFVISMDDFGSGYSTLNFMKTLPVDVIKIDGGFFMKNEMDKKSRAIISAIIQLSKNLDFNIVSEGVETKEQVDFVREQGARCVQGYYFYKPMPAEEFEELIK